MVKNKKYTAAGTDVEAVKQSNEQSGMSYNEAKEYIAKTTGGQGTAIYNQIKNTRDFSRGMNWFGLNLYYSSLTTERAFVILEVE